MTEKQLNIEFERSKLIIEMQRNASVKYKEEIVTCNNNKLSISRELFKCKGDLQLNKISYEQTLEAIKNAPHACKGWGWASDNVLCPMENAWQDSSTEVKYAVIAGVSVLAIATVGIAGYGVYSYFYAVPTANAAVVAANDAAADAGAAAAVATANAAVNHEAALQGAVLRDISSQLSKGRTHYNNGKVANAKLEGLRDYIMLQTREKALDYFNKNFDNDQQQYIGKIANKVRDYFNENFNNNQQQYIGEIANEVQDYFQ